MAVDANQGTLLRQRLSERQSFFGGTVSTREASAARRWDTLFDEPPAESNVGAQRLTTKVPGTGGARARTGPLTSPAKLQDDEAAKKQRRAAQLADFEQLGTDAPTTPLQPQPTPRTRPLQCNGTSSHKVPAVPRGPQEAAGSASSASAIRQARVASSGRPSMHSTTSQAQRSPASSALPSQARPSVPAASRSPLGANRRLSDSHGRSPGIRGGGISKGSSAKARVHVTKGGRKAAASRASAVAIIPSGNTQKQKAKAAWTAAIAKMLPPPGSRKSDLIAQQQARDQPQPSQLLAGLSIQGRDGPSGLKASRAACQPGTRANVTSRSFVPVGATSKVAGRGSTTASAAGRGRGTAASRPFPAGNGNPGVGMSNGGAPSRAQIQGSATFYPGGSGGRDQGSRGPSTASQTARRAFRDFGDDTFEEDLIDDGGTVDSELEDDIQGDGGGDWRAELRAITGYDPAKFAGERGDDRSMEVRNWAVVQAEERRSAREGAKEDAAAEKEELARLARKKQAKALARQKVS